MNLITLKKQIKEKKLDNLYLFTGEEIKVMEIFLQQMADSGNYEIVNLEATVNYYNRLGVKSFVQKPTIYVIRDDSDYIKQSDKVWNKVIDRPKNKNDIVVFIYNILDRRTKFYNRFKDFIVEFVKLPKNIVMGYLKKDFGFPEPVCDYIVTNCAENYNLCLLEGHKLKCFANQRNMDITMAFEICKNSGVLNRLPEDEILKKYIDSFLSKDFKSAYCLSKQLDIKVDPPLKVIAYLYNSFKALFNVVAYESGFALKKTESGVNFWAVKNVEIFGLHWSISEVYDMLKYLNKLEQNIKIGLVPLGKELDILLASSYMITKS